MIKTKKIILFLIICIMTVSIVSATEINMTENTDNNIQKQTTQEIQDNTNNQAQNTKLLNTSIKNVLITVLHRRNVGIGSLVT
jgi:CHASE3 domain sensor protein